MGAESAALVTTFRFDLRRAVFLNVGCPRGPSDIYYNINSFFLLQGGKEVKKLRKVTDFPFERGAGLKTLRTTVLEYF